jgi:hypothetical protein
MTTQILNAKYQQIIETPLPAFHAKIRSLTRKEWAHEVKNLFKSLGLGWVSVTAPSYSMASSIHIHFHTDEPWEHSAHKAKHKEIDELQRGAHEWFGYGTYCPWCKLEWAAHHKLEQIILAAFPDLDDRSDSQSDHFDSCLSIQ